MKRPEVKAISKAVRETVDDGTVGGGLYFDSTLPIKFISTGCVLFDNILGGGIVLGRPVNIIGDKSTGKTLLAMESIANFRIQYPKGRIFYFEAEAAFDTTYAEALGIPIDKVRFQSVDTVEDFFEGLSKIISYDTKHPTLVILDSLDALSDKAELGRGIDEGSYGAQKAKKMSELFRRLVRKIRDKDIGIIIISQVRDNIGVTFGRKTTRTGGRALDFYASQVIYLAQVETLKKTIDKVQRPIGIVVKAKIDKNKVGLPLRECQFTIRFGYGIDDTSTSLEWLDEIGRIDSFEPGGIKKILKRFEDLKLEEQKQFTKRLASVVKQEWLSIEKNFTPIRKKYL